MFGLSSFWKSSKPSEAPQSVSQTISPAPSIGEQIDTDLHQAETLLQEAVAPVSDNSEYNDYNDNCDYNGNADGPESNDADKQQEILDRIAQRPEGEFALYEEAANRLPQRILEIGVDDGQRAECLLGFSSLVLPASELFYFGMDWFEERTAEQKPGLEYMQAFQMLRQLGVPGRLQPGDPGTGFLNVANSLTAQKVDWIMVSEEMGPKIMRKLWPLFPRILDEDTRFFIEKGGRYRLVPVSDVNRIAQKAQKIQSGR